MRFVMILALFGTVGVAASAVPGLGGAIAMQVPLYTPAPPRAPAPQSPRLQTPTLQTAPTVPAARPGPAPFSPQARAQLEAQNPVRNSAQTPVRTPPQVQTLVPPAKPIPFSAPSPFSTPSPTLRPAPTPAPAYRGDWRDWPLTPGNWVYRQDARGSIALFGVPGADADFTIRCDRIAGQIYVSRKGAAPGNAPVTIRTSSSLRTLAMQPTGAMPAYMALSLFPRDPLLDAIGFSRGRFVLEQATLPVLVIPAWAEVLRVSEDCRP